ncbi:flagellar biosynthetic protein FliO [Nisaea sp.]|uniref:FliO/MopB family protein n=1 Tax=Nisaea sp. TaxID=2024842 RepID=UPI0032EABED9
MGLEIYVRLFFAFAFTIGLIGAVYWLARRYAGKLGIVRPHAAGRLSVIGQISLDARRRVMLIRCDGREHLLMLGPNNDLVIESLPASGSSGFQAALKTAESAENLTNTGEQP